MGALEGIEGPIIGLPGSQTAITSPTTPSDIGTDLHKLHMYR